MTSSPSTERSQALFADAQRLMPGGVSSPVRAWRGVGGTPVHIARGDGATVTDVDGNNYVDLVLSYGPLIVGHGHPAVKEALHAATESGTTFGAPTEAELDLARLVTERVPGLEMVRFVNSGTEATMSALRLARAVTGRDKMLKFEGCYHGHGDSFLVKAGSGALTLGAPDSPGVPADLAAMTLIAGYNDLDSVRALMTEHGSEIACVFVEPVAGNMGCIPPLPGFLEGLRSLCDEHGALLVFDEVMTGFRVARGCYVELTDVRPDLITMGKVIGGGLPIGAYGGSRELMENIAPAGPVYQAGTLSGNPLAVAAGCATLALLAQDDAYGKLEQSSARLEADLLSAAAAANVPLVVNRVGSMLCPYLSSKPVTNFTGAMASDRERWTGFFHGMLQRGVFLPPSPFETWFVSTAHDDAALDRVADAARGAFASI
ncbi:MAG: glutamate-1-semialdehyde 2,1-aminomutase [Planctomycetota bacterium]|jgi:glutamate-1-semialdehyde 2,1-aminomutase